MIKKWAVLVLGLSIVVLGAAAAAAQEGQGDPWPGGRGTGQRPGGGTGAAPLVGQLSELTGLTLVEIRQALRGGQTLAEIIEASGADLAAVTEQIIESVTERIQAQVGAGRLSQERAQALLAELPVMVEELLNAEPPLRGRFGAGNRAALDRYNYLILSVVEATGLTRAEVRSKLDAGMSYAAILEEAGQTLDAFIDKLLTPARERLAQAVSEGRITQAIADARLELMKVELEYRLTLTPRRAR